MFRPWTALLAALPVSTIFAQSRWDELTPYQVIAWPKNYFSFGAHYSGHVTAKFSKLGDISSLHDLGDTTSAITRTYDDGTVAADTRTDDAGNKLADDGRTNSWTYAFASQVTSDQSGIAFHSYSATSEGATAEASGGRSAGVDLEYAYRLKSFGRVHGFREPPFGWGVLFGFSANDLRARTTGTIIANLHTVTDTYSLLGSPPPDPGYSAPSSSSSTATSPDGVTTSTSIDTTTFLANRPDSRTEYDRPGTAKIDGTWDAHGAYYTLRAGNWFRWQPTQRFSMRATLGASVTVIGVGLRYYEQLNLTDVAEINTTISSSEDSKNFVYGVPGAFSGLDFEFWLTRQTGFFGSATYEKYSKQFDLPVTARSVDIQVNGGGGIRFGITTRF